MSALVDNVCFTAIILGINYGLYSYLTPFSFQNKSIIYYGILTLFICLLYSSIKLTWNTAKELLHFFHWLGLLILDRNPGKYAMIEEARKIKKAKRAWEESEEYKIEKQNKEKLELFYSKGIVSPDIYYLLGKEEGMQSGEIDGIKSTYNTAFAKGRVKRKEDVEAENRRKASNQNQGFNNSCNNSNEKSLEQREMERLQQFNRELWEKRSQARAYGDKDWFTKI